LVDYGKLADKAKAQQQAAKPGGSATEAQQADPAELYERVKIAVLEEADKANIELNKRRMQPIERVFSPSYKGRLCLSFGTTLICSVDYTAPAGGCRIAAILCGPPNGTEISRKEFLAAAQSPEHERMERLGAIPWARGMSPQRIAVDIVSGLLAGEFA